MDLTVVKHELAFQWNFEEVKSALVGHIEKYADLIVTDDNLKDMEETQKEIASVRIKIDGFRKEVRKKMEEPYSKFDGEIKELQSLVEKAERPLKDQLAKYETKRIEDTQAKLLEFARKLAEGIGLREEFFAIAIKPAWTNRTAKQAAVRKEITIEVETCLDRQRRDDEAKELLRQTEIMLANLCESESKNFGLATPVTSEDVKRYSVGDIGKRPLSELPNIVVEVCRERQEMERKAAEATQKVIVDMSAPMPPVVPMATPVMPPVTQPAPPPMPPVMPPNQQLFDVGLKLPRITIMQAQALKEFMATRGIQYQIMFQEEIK